MEEKTVEKLICIINSWGDEFWFLNNRFHRENDLPAIIWNDESKNGSKEWYLNGKLHRENDLPTIEYYNGTKYWYLNNEIHRENGPASEFSDGGKAWYWHYKYIEVNSQEEFEEKLPYLIMKDLNEK